MADETPAAAGTEGITGQLAIQKIYIKNASFEAPSSPKVFT